MDPFAFPPPEVENELPPLYDFWEILDEAIIEKQIMIPRLRPSESHYPSSASIEIFEHGEKTVKGACLRKAFWDRTSDEPVIPDPTALWKMQSGDYISEMIVEYTKRKGIYIADEVAFYDVERNISGRVDLIYNHPILKTKVGVEIKSVGGYQAKKNVLVGKNLKPKISHLLQTIIYLDFMETHLGITKFEIVYYARCDAARKVFAVTFGTNREAFVDGTPTGVTPQMIYDRFALLDSYLEKNELPPKDFELQYPKEKLVKMAKMKLLTDKQSQTVLAGKRLQKGDPQCGYCPYQKKCWG